MKVLHISTHLKGGAANAALRLHQGLIQEEVDSSFMYLKGSSFPPDSFIKYPEVSQTNLWLRILRRFGLFQPLCIKNRIKLKQLQGNYDYFSFSVTDYNRLHEHPAIKSADIIHLHWVADFIDWPTFFSNICKPVVWTLHDMNPFQGGFHYAEDIIQNQKSHKNLDEQQAQVKIRAIKNIENLTICAPSSWLKENSQYSQILGSFHHEHIQYGLDTNVFRKFDQEFAREVFQLPKEAIILLFVSHSIDKYRKGFDLLMSAIDQLNGKEFVLVAAGKSSSGINNTKIINVGNINDDRMMALLYSAADAFILPSREDNLPNTMLESLACGTPVIATPVGGMLDVIKDRFNGYLASSVSSESLRKAIELFLANPKLFNRDLISEDANDKFNQSIQAQRYKLLYRSIV